MNQDVCIKEEYEKEGDFLAQVSHEIRNPINCIVGAVDLLKMSTTPKQTDKYLDILTTSCKHLRVLVDDILVLSTLKSRNFVLKEENSSVLEIVTNAINIVLYSNKKEGKHIQFYRLIDADIPSHIYTDKVRLTQVLVNLLGNAFKFTEKGKVILKVYKREKNIFFQIIDTGIGISKENLQKLFKPFSTIPCGNEIENKNTGLGLFISKQIVELLGGKITVESKEGTGSIFTVQLKF